MEVALPISAIAARNPFLVIAWSLGLFMLMHGHQYVGSLFIAWRTRKSFDDVMSGKFEDRTTLLVRGVAAMVVGLPLIWLSTTVLWRRPLGWMGFSFHVGWLLLGLAIGLVSPAIVVGFLCLLKRARISRPHSLLTGKQIAVSILGIGFMAVFAGVSEEVVFRAMAARELLITLGWFWTVLLSGAFFGFVHLLGQCKLLTARKTSGIMISSIVVSSMFIAMYARSGSLWLPIGFHLAWNFSYTAILGLRMNGEAPETSAFQTALSESSWMTGGSSGVEASAPAMALYALVGLLFVLL